jgi:hypothetical protein
MHDVFLLCPCGGGWLLTGYDGGAGVSIYIRPISDGAADAARTKSQAM